MNESNKQAMAMFHAYIDGQLSASAVKQFEFLTDKNPGLKKQVQQQQLIRNKIRREFDIQSNSSDAVARLRLFVNNFAEQDTPIADAKPVDNEPLLDYTHNDTIIEISGDGETEIREFDLPESDTSSWVKARLDKAGASRLHPLVDRVQTLFRSPQQLINSAMISIGLLLVFFLGLLLGGGDNEGSAVEGESVLSAVELLAIDAHRIYAAEKRHAVEVPASDLEHLMTWLSGRLQTKVGPAKFDQQGFQLIGGRLLPSVHKHAAFYLYHNNANQRISLIIRQKPETDQVEMSCKSQSELQVCRWQGKKLVYFLVSGIELDDLSRIASIARKQMP